MPTSARALLLLALLATAARAEAPAAPAGEAEAFFERKVRPVLAGTCFRCHGGERIGGKLRVDSREALVKGGESGPALVPGAPEESLLIGAIRHADEPHMPPDKPLPPGVVADFAAWVRAGAPWGAARPESFVHRAHWAFAPVKPAAPPDDPEGRASDPIDRFLNAALRARGIHASDPADPRTLLRRLTFDLTGLPPTPEELEAFVADPSPGTYAKAVDRLLASPHYGERWGRHWLDVVRYADTAGETADFPAPLAWRYRDYVIGAFNRDLPFDQFLREQLAGDVLAQREPSGRFAEQVVATGYLAVARRFGFDLAADHYLTIEDTIDVLGKSVLGLTVACARCHDHKYDPISQADYYALYGIFESTRYPFPGCEKEKRPRDLVPLVPPDVLEARTRALDADVRRADEAKAGAERRLAAVAAESAFFEVGGTIPNGGAEAFPASGREVELGSVRVRPGEMIVLTVLPRENHGADSTFVGLEVVEEGPKGRTWSLARDLLAGDPSANPHPDASGHADVWFGLAAGPAPAVLSKTLDGANGMAGLRAWRGGEETPCVVVNANEREAAYVTVRQPARSVAVHPGPRGGVAVAWRSPIEGVVSVRGELRDIDPTGGDGVAWTLCHRPGFGPELLEAAEARRALEGAAERRRAYPGSAEQAYAVAEGSPHDAQLHRRGDPANRGEVVPRRLLGLLGGDPLPPGAGSGRLSLAEWLTRPTNPLVARVMVNRIWLGHFGAGLVKTPNDFGTRGAPPSHPELLDYLASEFVAGGWSVKAMHRRIVLTDAYRRSASARPEDVRADPDNTWLGRFPRRRLDAEEIRDAILAVSGDLDRAPGGPHPFPEPSTWEFTQHAPFSAVYEHDRRSVYLMAQRIKRHPFLALFDGADPNASTGARQSTTVPTQALFFLNDPFVHAKSARLAARLMALPDEPARLDRACRLILGRPPGPDDAVASARFLAAYEAALPPDDPADRRRTAWAAWLRVMLSSNEFLYP